MSDWTDVKIWATNKASGPYDYGIGQRVLALIAQNARLKQGAVEDLRLRTELMEQYNQLKAENEALRKDAARIDFIEEEWFYVTWDNNQEFCFVEAWSAPGETLRDAIDAAMGKGEQS